MRTAELMLLYDIARKGFKNTIKEALGMSASNDEPVFLTRAESIDGEGALVSDDEEWDALGLSDSDSNEEVLEALEHELQQQSMVEGTENNSNSLSASLPSITTSQYGAWDSSEHIPYSMPSRYGRGEHLDQPPSWQQSPLRSGTLVSDESDEEVDELDEAIEELERTLRELNKKETHRVFYQLGWQWAQTFLMSIFGGPRMPSVFVWGMAPISRFFNKQKR